MRKDVDRPPHPMMWAREWPRVLLGRSPSACRRERGDGGPIRGRSCSSLSSLIIPPSVTPRNSPRCPTSRREASRSSRNWPNRPGARCWASSGRTQTRGGHLQDQPPPEVIDSRRLSWRHAGKPREVPARLINISRAGAALIANTPPPEAAAVLIRLMGVEPTPWIEADVLGVEPDARGRNRVRVEWHQDNLLTAAQRGLSFFQ